MFFARIKQIDKIIVRSFLIYFFALFFIIGFVSLMSVFYEYMRIIIDKNLGFRIYIRIIFNFLLVFFPTNCAIATIFSSVLCFVKLSENLQICAMKSFGISFKRMLQPLLITVFALGLFISFSSHYFSPLSMKNTVDLLIDLQNINPAVMIKEGVFNNDIPNVSIFVKKKNDNDLKDIIVYDHSSKNTEGSNTLLLANKAKLDVKDKSISLYLNKGTNYLEYKNDDKNATQNIKIDFDKQNIIVDMNKIKNKNNSKSLHMKDSIEIINMIKKKKYERKRHIDKIIDFIKENRKELFDGKDIKTKKRIVKKISNSIINNKFNDKVIKKSIDIKRKMYTQFNYIYEINYALHFYKIVIYKRILETIVCFLFLLLGAAIGVLLKRGSFIIHIIFVIFFIIIYYTSDLLGKIFFYDSIIGNSFGIITLLPFVFFFLLHASKDSQILNEGLNNLKYRITLFIKKYFKIFV